jgi:dolichyl-phosphate beta-glucosyltransferase
VRFSVIVPAYREAGRIGDTVAALRTVLAGVRADGGAEIVVVDDGSDDGTAAAARAAGADIVVEFGQNRGKGEAVRAGMRASSGEVVAFTDADLAYAPNQLVGLLEEVERGADMAVGDRRHPDSVAVTGLSWLRRTGSLGVGLLRGLLGLGRGRDTQCGLKAFSSRAAGAVLDASVMDRFSFDVEVLFLADRLGMEVRQVPVEVVNSNVSSVRVFSDGWELVLDMCRIRTRALLGRYPSNPGG